MLVAAAVVPHPPLLVPHVAGGAAPELDLCRMACAQAIDSVLETGLDLLVVVGGGSHTRVHETSSIGTVRPYGVAADLGPGTGPASLPLSLGIARWLLGDRVLPPLVLQEVESGASPDACSSVGLGLAGRADRVGLIVAADGSAFASQTPVGDDGRGTAYDDRIASALETGDADLLLSLDPDDDAALWVAGRAAFQALAGALGPKTEGWHGHLRWRGAPYGVGYVVAALHRT